MRSLLVLTVLGRSAAAEPSPPKAKIVKPQPCPKDIAKKLVGEYDGGANASSIEINACVWANLAGPGWFVSHVIPWGKHSHAESPPNGGETFVGVDGKIVVSNGVGSFGSTGRMTARAIDLDGDGTDEIVETQQWSSSMSPESGESIAVIRVTEGKIDRVFQQGITLEVMADTPCTGTLAIVAGPRNTKQLVVTEKARDPSDSPRDPTTSQCLSKGKHVFVYTKDTGVTEKP